MPTDPGRLAPPPQDPPLGLRLKPWLAIDGAGARPGVPEDLIPVAAAGLPQLPDPRSTEAKRRGTGGGDAVLDAALAAPMVPTCPLRLT
jgi:hypothetical protein